MPYFSEEIAVPIRWQWKNFILAGDVTVHVGEEGKGKSTQAADIVARVSQGWPDPPYDVLDPTAPDIRTAGQAIIISSEDRTYKHKLQAAGADQTKVMNLSNVKELSTGGNTTRRKFSLPRDIPLLKSEIQNMGDVRLVLMDPLLGLATETVAFNRLLRINIIDPLQEVAYETGAAIWIMHHFNKGVTMKNMLDKINGSAGIRQAVRHLTLVADDQLDPDIKVMFSGKHSYTKGTESLEYIITGDFPDTHVRYRTPPPTINDQNMDKLQAHVLAMLVNAERPVSSQELATYTRLSHGIVSQLIAKSEAEGLVLEQRGAWIAAPAIEGPKEESDATDVGEAS